MRREDAIRILSVHTANLRQRFGVRSLALFGSVARDEAGPESDIDLLVEFERSIGLFGFVELQQCLEDLLGCRVDLVTSEGLKRQLRARILSDAVYAT
jgi:predicted nucleotidyltransferase